MYRSSQTDFQYEFGRFIKILAYLASIAILVFAMFLLLGILRISSFAFNTYDSYDEVPYNKVGLLLGTSSNVAPGQPNEYFTNRIMAAANLYRHKKIDYILVSGDNRHASYNEPRQMMQALLKAGVPQDRIVADYAGFRTNDSVIRAHKVFMLNKVTIISQEFHNERALFIANHLGIDAIGFNASDPYSEGSNFKVKLREFFARIKCVIDMYILHTKPTFLGDPIEIGSTEKPINDGATTPETKKAEL